MQKIEKSDLDRELWIENHCECGIDKFGAWSESLFEYFGCQCDPAEPKG
jgi:hypothetical protein